MAVWQAFACCSLRSPPVHHDMLFLVKSLWLHIPMHFVIEAFWHFTICLSPSGGHYQTLVWQEVHLGLIQTPDYQLLLLWSSMWAHHIHSTCCNNLSRLWQSALRVGAIIKSRTSTGIHGWLSSVSLLPYSCQATILYCITLSSVPTLPTRPPWASMSDLTCSFLTNIIHMFHRTRYPTICDSQAVDECPLSIAFFGSISSGTVFDSSSTSLIIKALAVALIQQTAQAHLNHGGAFSSLPFSLADVTMSLQSLSLADEQLRNWRALDTKPRAQFKHIWSMGCILISNGLWSVRRSNCRLYVRM